MCALSLHAIRTLRGLTYSILLSYNLAIYQLPLGGQWHSFAKAELTASLGKRNGVAATEQARSANPYANVGGLRIVQSVTAGRWDASVLTL
jgi:hypothetical protein